MLCTTLDAFVAQIYAWGDSVWVSTHRVQSRLLSAAPTFLVIPVRRSYVNEKSVLFCSNNLRSVVEVSGRWRHDRTLSPHSAESGHFVLCTCVVLTKVS